MEFFFAVFFLLFYYVRPQDWVPGLAGLNLIKPIIAIWLGALIAARSQPSPLPGVLKTPHDWAILSYFIYVVWTAVDMMPALTGFLSLAAFYALTVQSVNSWERLESYLKWWVIALVILAAFGVLITVGIDFTGGQAVTEANLGRLALGTWQHNNPNALGHSVIVAIPAGYFLFFWRGNTLGKWVIFPAIAALACWCVYLTESKGAFLVGGILVASLYVVGRPKFVQLIVIITALTLGVGALSFLPRMSEMGNIRSADGVEGRLLAWEKAREVTKEDATGVGWNQFIALISWREGNSYLVIPKATHSSYVQVAADLGRYGLFLYLACLWCVANTLLKFRPANDMEDRCRRVVWVLLLSSLSSGWMINLQYHVEYFLIVAAAAAMHRLAKGRELETLANRGSVVTEGGSPGPLLLGESADAGPIANMAVTDLAFTTAEDDGAAPAKPLWNRFGLLDLGVCIGLTWLTFWVWDYILKNL
jgi:O-Antigen ligase